MKTVKSVAAAVMVGLLVGLPYLASLSGTPAPKVPQPTALRSLRPCVVKSPKPAPGNALAARLPAREKAALVTAARWEPGATIRISFGADVSQSLRDELLRAAAEWSTHANIDFVAVASGPSEVRVSADPNGGSWSYVGKGVLQVPAGEPTLNLGWPDDYARSLHELGHTLGLIHEHENPAVKIPWNVPAVLAYYMTTQGWSAQEVVEQVLTPDNEPLTNGGYDEHSIMEYPIPAALVTDPSFAVDWNESLSEKDVAFIRSVYPGRDAPKPPAPPATPPAGPGDGFRFHAPEAGDYEVSVKKAA